MRLHQKLKSWLVGQLMASERLFANAQTVGAASQIDHEDAKNLVPFDENLLERSRTQWQFGDWENLAKLEHETLQHHPDRGRLALLAVAGRLQTGKIDEAKKYIRLAKDWGVSTRLLTRILAAGVHNSLGRASAIVGDQPHAIKHFSSSIEIGSPNSEVRLLVQARVVQQYQHIGLPVSPATTVFKVGLP